MRIFKQGMLLALGLVVLPGQIFAQVDDSESEYNVSGGRIEELVVRGAPLPRREIDTVASVAVYDGDSLEQRQLPDIYDLLLRSANLNAASEDSFSIRGISNTGVGDGGLGRPTVSVFVDGVRQGGRGVANLFDIDQVEVYRGPQSTAFGPGSLAGAIVVNTRDADPRQGWNANMEWRAGNHGREDWGAAVGVPLTETLALRLVAQSDSYEGDVSNVTLNDEQWRQRTRRLQRIKLAWQPLDGYEADLSLQRTQLNSGPDYMSPELAEDYKATDNEHGYYKDDTDLVALRQYLSLNEQLSFMLLLSHSDTRNERRGDYDISARDNGFFLGETRMQNRSAELRSHIRSESVDAVVGLYSSRDELYGTTYSGNLKYSTSGINADTDSIIGAGRDARVRSIYSELDWRLAQQWMLTLGARYEENEADNAILFRLLRAQAYEPATGIVIPGDLTPVLQATVFPDVERAPPSGDSVALAKLGLRYEFTEALNGFATLSQGYRAGSTDFVVSGDSPAFGPELSNNLDLGLRWHGEQVQSALSVFYIDYQDMQVGVRVDPTTIRTDNVGSAEAYGLEWEGRWWLADSVSLDWGLGYVHTEFEEYRDGDEDFAGNAFPLAPDWSANLGLEWRPAPRWFTRMDMNLAAASYTDRANTDSLKADARQLVSVSGGYETGQWGVQIGIKNLLNQFYITDQYTSESLAMHGVIVGEPRQIAMSLKVHL